MIVKFKKQVINFELIFERFSNLKEQIALLNFKGM